MTSKDNILEDKHLWVKARDITVQPGIESIAGFKGFYMPPLAAGPSQIRVTFNGTTVVPESYEWRIGEFVRKGAYRGVEIETHLVPVTGRGISLSILLRNTSGETQAIKIQVTPDLRFADLRSGNWGWVPPQDGDPVAPKPTDFGLTYASEFHEILVSADGFPVKADSLEKTVHLNPSVTKQVQVSLAIWDISEARKSNPTDTTDANPDAPGLKPSATEDTADTIQPISPEEAENAIKQSQDDYQALRKQFPTFKSSSPELDAFYERGIVTYGTCLWKSPHFALKEHIAESGIDGGAICNYPWGIAYISKILSLADPKPMRDHIIEALKADLFNHYAYTPLDGKAVGPWYSYNQYAIVCTVYHYVVHSGDTALLSEKVNGKTVYELLLGHATYKDDLAKPVALIDCGNNDNLLEMKRTTDYEHFVPSPNAERCWNLEAVGKLAGLAGQPSPQLKQRADDIRKLIRQKLWDSTNQWLGSIGLDGALKPCYSIQVFDTLRFDVLEPEQQKAVVERLNSDEFLSKFGVHSLSKCDPGFDPNDVDWGGPGVYAGDGPELVEDLYHAGFLTKGDEILKSLLWWGQRLPYYPQAICAATLDYRHDGRANVVAGLKVNELLVFGLLGLEIHPDKSITINAHLPSFLDYCEISDVNIFEQQISFRVESKGVQYSINGKKSNWMPLRARLSLES
jgi:hypothetical protein